MHHRLYRAPQAPGDAREDRGRPMGEERIVAREELVAAVAGEGHRHVAAGEAREQQGRQEARIREGLVELRGRRRDQIQAVLAGELLRHVLGAQPRGGELRPRRLVEALLDESDGERLQRLLVPHRERGDGGGIDSAGEEHADGHVGHQTLRHGRVEQPEQLARRIGGGDALLRGPRHFPVPAEAESAVIQDRDVRRRELAHTANMPWTCSANSSPHSRYARSTTSVSLLLLKGCPFARSSSRSEAKSYASPLKTTATASRIIGWSPDSRSRMASLRCPSAAGPSKKNASASGPRWAIARAALRTPSASGAPARSTSPQMPHIYCPTARGSDFSGRFSSSATRYGRLPWDS